VRRWAGPKLTSPPVQRILRNAVPRQPSLCGVESL
jgi:hypothetical protein